jgi:hypothetical protein
MLSTPLQHIQDFFEADDASDFPIQSTEIDWEKIRIWLENAIGQLLAHQPEQLAQAMYRIDVSEVLFREAFYQGDIVKMTDLVIERTKQKIALRAKYSNA